MNAIDAAKNAHTSQRPSAFTAVLARRLGRTGAGGLIDHPALLFISIKRPDDPIAGFTFYRVPPYEPCLHAQRDRERGWRDRGRCGHDAPLSRDAHSRGV